MPLSLQLRFRERANIPSKGSIKSQKQNANRGIIVQSLLSRPHHAGKRRQSKQRRCCLSATCCATD
ncbi:protein of unknown function [Nitratireductor aquimarinus]